MDIPRNALVKLLEEDGISLPSGDGAEKVVRCFSAHHEDKTPSMSVNVTDGVYKCHGCGIGGGVWHYLTEIRELPSAEAMELLKNDFGWSPDRIAHEQDRTTERQEQQTQRAKGRPRWSDRIVNAQHMVAEHDYIDADAVLVAKVVRYRPPSKYKVMPHTPSGSKGTGWWLAKPTHDGLPEEDRTDKVPLYNLPYLLERLENNQAQQIWVVEGEKCADAVNNLPYGGENEPPVIPPATTLIGGSGRRSYTDVDMELLYGRRLMLIADTDESGRGYMERLAHHLYNNGAQVRICLPSGEGGYDIADAIAEGGYEAALDWAKPTAYDYKPPVVNPATSLHPDAPADALGDNQHYRILGVTSDGAVIFQRKKTHAIVRKPQTSLAQPHNLVPLAPLQYWSSMTGSGSLSRNECLALQDGLIREAEGRGMVRTDFAIGRGAAIVNGEYVYNLGDMILLPDPQERMTVQAEFAASEALFLPRPVVHVTEDLERAREYAEDLHNVIVRYRWSKRNHARAFCGWLVASLIGGALDHRPALWLLADRDTGKTFLLEKILGAMLGETVTSLADTSEAGLAAMVGADSLPVYIDEFESTDTREHTWSSLLKLLRISTGGQGFRARGTVTGDYTVSHPRFTLLVASTRQPDLKPTDQSRIITVALSRRGVSDWATLRADIAKVTTYEADAGGPVGHHPGQRHTGRKDQGP